MSHTEIGYDKVIRELGYRLTPQREIIMNTLCEINEHATVHDVYQRVYALVPSIDRATVYRTLHFFRELRLISATDINGETFYEVSGVIPHHHLICRVCGAEKEFEDYHLHDLINHLREKHDFVPEIDHLVITGRCRDCI
ncbi:MAG: Fur family transcriptional regulator [Candidatus Promineifilaceae bacterium]|nr:Fur family transcriptional regulator [Candidatus Promineifilaceae bacterium]